MPTLTRKNPILLRYTRQMTSISSNTNYINRAIVVRGPGGPDVAKLEYLDIPEVKPTQILIKNKYAGVNFADTWFRKAATSFPLFLGRESAGEVVAVGDKVTNYKPGDRVGYVNLHGGGYADYIALEADHYFATKLPEDISDKDWATSAVNVITAETLLKDAHDLKQGQTALIYAPVGGVGQCLVTRAKDLGATVIAVTSSTEREALAKQLGADYTINYNKDNIPEKVKEFTEGKGVNVVFDSLGADTYQYSIDSLGLNGNYVLYGAATGPVPPVNLQDLPALNPRITRSSVFTCVRFSGIKLYADTLFDRVRQKAVGTTPYKVYSLEEYSQAARELEARTVSGKLVLKI